MVCNLFAAVAQMVEHFIGNEEVSGSSPPSSFAKPILNIGLADISRRGSAWLERCVRDAEVASSNLVASIFLF